jgi:MoaA/NifB/PqqE/SkfB family radical SAM enzyme
MIQALSTDRTAPPATPLPHEPRVVFQVGASGNGSAGELRVASVPAQGSYAYVDLVYVAHNEHGGEIAYQCADFTLRGRVLPGGRRSHSLAIPLAALAKSRTISFSSTSPLGIESAVVRRDFYDFMGLRSGHPSDPQTLENELRATARASTIGPSIQWFITWKCNLTCAYCWQEVAADRYRHGRLNAIEPQRWVESFERLGPRELHLTGGEPSLYKKLPELIALVDPKIALMMNSNLGRAFGIERFLEHVPPHRFRELTFSLHPTQVPLAEFFEKLARLKYADYRNLITEMVLYPLNLPYAAEVVQRCRELGVSLRFDPYVPAASDALPRDEAMFAEMRRWIQIASDHSRGLGEVGQWSFEKPQYFEAPPAASDVARAPGVASGRLPIFCAAGSRRINVDDVGDVYACMSAIDRSKMFDRLALPHYAPLGNVFDADFALLDRPIICWESFRCSACDFQVVDPAWTRVSDALHELPLPE